MHLEAPQPGDRFAKIREQLGSEPTLISDNRIQILLAKLQFADDSNPLSAWTDSGWSVRYRDYVDAHPNDRVAASDEAGLTALLASIGEQSVH